MTATSEDLRAALRRGAYALVIIAAVGGALGRIATVSSPNGETIFLSANDRSRWSAIRALGDQGTHVIDEVIIRDPEGKTIREKFDRDWHSIDMVKHKGHDGREHYYSSKPTLLTTLLAGEYWLIKQVTGATLAEQPHYVGRIMLVFTNLLPLALYFWLLARLIERYGTTDWGRLLALTAAAFGTFLTTFAITLNNHLIAAVSVLVTVYAALPIWTSGERRLRYFIIAGYGAAFAAANELPALSFLAVVGAGLFWKSPGRTITGFVPPVAVVVAAALGTNYLAHGSWKTPYAHRQDGEVLMTLPANLAAEIDAGRVPNELVQGLAEKQIQISGKATITKTTPKERWVLWDEPGHDRLAIVKAGNELEVRAWDNWYEYAESYWSPERKQSVDRGEPSRLAYAFHLLVGHHGLFSLTPIWLLTVMGIGLILAKREHALYGLAAMTTLLTFVCLAFYISRPLADRNYGGFTCGLRWLFWLIPLWLLCLLPAADATASRKTWRIGAAVLLLASVASAGYAALNPWTHPWLYKYWLYLEWVVE
jgi:hypothetical protein